LATLQTIADAVGVSRASVSNAYNHPERLGEDLRERILAKARELGYAGPDPAARRLRHGRAGAVGLLLTEALSYAFSDPAAVIFLEGLARRCEERESPLLLLPLAPSGEAASTAVREAVVDALCVYSLPDGHPALAVAHERRLPLVVVDEPRIEGAAYVGIDDKGGTRRLGERLVELGHRDVAMAVPTLIPDGYEGFVTPERLAAAYHIDRERIAGYWEAFDTTDTPIYECANRQDAGARAAAALLGLDPRPTAILCNTDQIALGALPRARELGVSVAGFDDVPEAETAGLTTVRQPLEEKGLVAGDLLLEGDQTREVILPAEPVIRESTVAPSI
jgi:DNA-binding LacI/PurR family transcriptional regulator